MPEHDAVNKGAGGTMRLGLRETVFLTDNCKLSKFFLELIFTSWCRQCCLLEHRGYTSPAIHPLFHTNLISKVTFLSFILYLFFSIVIGSSKAFNLSNALCSAAADTAVKANEVKFIWTTRGGRNSAI